MLKYEQFEEAVREHFEQEYHDRTAISFHQVHRNNGIVMQGMSVHMPGYHVMPTVYLEEFYEHYVRGMSMEDVIKGMERTLADGCSAGGVDVEYFKKYESAQDTLRLKLVNYEYNQESLKRMPHRRLLDLAMVCYSEVPGEACRRSAIMVTNEHLLQWGISEGVLFDRALENNQRYEGRTLTRLREMLCEMQPQLRQDERMQEEEGPVMYVLTGRSRINGAAVLWYPDTLSRCADEIGRDFYILPSSIHELILLEAWDNEEERLLSMVEDVNEEQVADEEILSNHVYHYSVAERCLTDIVTKEKLCVQ